jgi:hypothetical protein
VLYPPSCKQCICPVLAPPQGLTLRPRLRQLGAAMLFCSGSQLPSEWVFHFDFACLEWPSSSPHLGMPLTRQSSISLVVAYRASHLSPIEFTKAAHGRSLATGNQMILAAPLVEWPVGHTGCVDVTRPTLRVSLPSEEADTSATGFSAGTQNVEVMCGHALPLRAARACEALVRLRSSPCSTVLPDE